MRTSFSIRVAIGLVVCLLAVDTGYGQIETNPHTIFGVVVELRSGTADVPVCLCDGTTGLPLSKDSYQPVVWGRQQPDTLAKGLAITTTDSRGRFRFDKVPDGKYRLVAQKWTGPFKGVFEEHGTVIQLMGAANDIVVPRPSKYYEAQVTLTPPGRRIVQFDQDVGNSDTFMFLSSAEPEFDPALGLSAMGSKFFTKLVGVNRMPLGKTTVIGVSNESLYAFFFAPDNSPGFAAIRVPASKSPLVRVPTEPFVAAWSDGRKTPPNELADLMDLLDKHSVKCSELLKIPELSAATYEAHRKHMKRLQTELSREIKLPEGRTARVGDILAIRAYQRLAK